MRSRVYMNHYPSYVSNDKEAVTADLTASVKELAYDRGPGLGKAVALTFRTLGIDRLTTPPHPSDLLVIGSVDRIADRLPDLRKTIATIATNAVDPDDSAYKRIVIGDTIDSLAQSVIPASLNSQRGFIEVVGESLSEFGEDCNDDGCLVEYGCRVGWYSTIHEYGEVSRGIPPYVFDNVTNLEILNKDNQTEEVSFATRLLASRARARLVQDPEAAKLLKKDSRA